MHLYARLYVDLELEALQLSGSVGLPGTPNLETTREQLLGRWKDLPFPRQVELGPRILDLRKAFKDYRDTERQFNYVAARYRGAPDDFMQDSEADWRPGFGLFDEKAAKCLTEARKMAASVQAVMTSRNAGPEDPGTVALKSLWEKVDTFAQDLANDRRTQHPEMKKAADTRMAQLDRQEKRPMTPEPEEPICEAEPPTGTDGDTDVEMTDTDEIEPAWHGRLELGRGSYGAAYLWLKTDARGKIRERVVQKVCELTNMWSKNVWWSNGAPGNMGIGRQTVPNEIRAHLALRRKPGSESVVELLNYNLRYADKAADLYLEFCPFGDAYELLKQGYHSKSHGDRDKYDFEDHRSECKFIPEPFCWSAFQSLVLAGLLMANGTTDTSSPNAADPEWRLIVHRDLKLDNVFLGIPARDRFRGYPQLKVADFGGAIFIPPNDSRPPEDLMTLATKDHSAPEMDCALRYGRRDELIVPQSSKTNVWGIGIILYRLLSGRHGPVHPSSFPAGYFQWALPSRREPPDFDESTRLFYSDDLLNLVLACLRYDDRDRPTLEYLIREVRRCTNPHSPEEDRAAGLKNRRENDEGYEVGRWGLNVRRDGWRVGLALGEVGFVSGGTGEKGDVAAKLFEMGL
ncbi:Putative serine/threonine-protein kinase Atg1 [Septoria linicola]|uniref:Serine/threonine-protein kinase Atg1 n=1 Tax=Septoria linicola TaxID=215465 RepID=A0A9Q9ATJ6_9PEZI|nr:Putative serine/threonine-protein kinase Atg1 [Septoria linicola]